MRILELIDVTFTGKMDRDLDNKMFIVEDDKGVRTEVLIPQVGNLVEQFRWLGDTNNLKNLYSLQPKMTDNSVEIQEVYDFNARLEENYYLTSTYSNNGHRQYNYTSNSYSVAGMKPIPIHTWTATWTFVGKEAAVMFKLAMGGKQ
jgi:hypothetical protein